MFPAAINLAAIPNWRFRCFINDRPVRCRIPLLILPPARAVEAQTSLCAESPSPIDRRSDRISRSKSAKSTRVPTSASVEWHSLNRGALTAHTKRRAECGRPRPPRRPIATDATLLARGPA